MAPEHSFDSGNETGHDRGVDASARFRAGVVREAGVRSCSLERWWPGQQANQLHGSVAARTERSRQRCGRLQRWRVPIEQCEDALPFGFGGGAQPAEGAHALESPRQDVLEKAVQETLRREPQGSSLAGAAFPVAEGDEEAVVVEDALGAEGGAIHVSSEILEGRLAPADRLHIGHPIDRPDFAWDLDEE